MSRRLLALATTFTSVAVLGAAAAAQQPRIINGRLTPQAVSSNLSQTFRSLVASQAETGWIGYNVPVSGERMMCCFANANGTTYISGSFVSSDGPCCGACRIEPSTDTATAVRERAAPGSRAQDPVKLEGSQRMVVMFRVVDRQVERIRTFSEECELDAGGRQVHWLQDVRAAESIALLTSLVGQDGDRKSRITNGAISAIGMHADGSAAITLVALARDHASPAVRGDALFWVAQLAGQKAIGTITAAIENDPDTDVKKRAVFALSQLPQSEGVPLLISVARKNQNPAVRKQAMFWLGQSKDPRATEFFAEILK
ncbi:MAG: HEAT repeat domain-containing protein [Vicinamibacterales bacterium]